MSKFHTYQFNNCHPYSHVATMNLKKHYNRISLIYLLSGAKLSNVMTLVLVIDISHFPQTPSLKFEDTFVRPNLSIGMSILSPSRLSRKLYSSLHQNQTQYILVGTVSNKSQTGKDFSFSSLATLHYREELGESREGSTVHLV